MYRESAVPQLGTLWVSRAGADPRAIPADGCADIILRDGELIVAGPSTRWILARNGSEGFTIGFRFRPWLAGAALGVDPAELRDQSVPARDALPASIVRHADAALRGADALLGETGASPASLASAARSAADRLGGRTESVGFGWAGVVHAAARAHGTAYEIAHHLELSERQLHRRMLSTFGYGFAALRGTLRAERASALIRRGEPLAVAAEHAGYADQPHMTREFARIVGVTPGQLASRAA